MKKFTKTKLFKIILIAAFFALIIYINPQKILNPVRSGMAVVLSPFEKVFYSLSIGFENIKEFISSIGELKKENERLMKENQNLISESVMLQDVKNENLLLREQINLIPRDKYDLISAFVISQDPSGTGNWIEIDKGVGDGIEEGMPVIASKGFFIGRIQEARISSSKIILLTNPESDVNVMTLENNSKGLVSGEYGLGMMLTYVLQSDSLNDGDKLITSGIGGDIPRGLYVGTVHDIHMSEDRLFQQASVTAPVQVSKLQMVFVIKNVK